MPTVHYAAGSDLQLEGAKLTGAGSCAGGKNPSLHLHNYPLLAWMHDGHPVHGTDVFTEDQRASVANIARATAETPSLEAVATRFGTTADHVIQALDYAVEAGFLSLGK